MPTSTHLILIVTHVAEDRHRLRHLLTQEVGVQQHNHVVEADVGFAVLDTCRRERPDCILLDTHLPDAQSQHILQSLVAEFGLNPIPVVLLAGEGEAEITLVMAALQAGVHDFVVKRQVHAVELQRAISNAIAKVSLIQTRPQLEADDRRQSLPIEPSTHNQVERSHARIRGTLSHPVHIH